MGLCHTSVARQRQQLRIGRKSSWRCCNSTARDHDEIVVSLQHVRRRWIADRRNIRPTACNRYIVREDYAVKGVRVWGRRGDCKAATGTVGTVERDRAVICKYCGAAEDSAAHPDSSTAAYH